MLETPVFEGHSNRVSREEIKDPTKNCIALCMQKENRSVHMRTEAYLPLTKVVEEKEYSRLLW